MKKTLVLAVTFVVSAVLCLSGCSLGSGDRQGELESIYEDTLAQLDDTFSDSGSKFTMVEEYIKSWAKTNDIKVTDMADTYMILRNAATEGAGDVKSVTLQCSVDTSDMITSNHLLATGLTALLGPETHGATKLLITDAGNNDFAGVRAVTADKLKTGSLINLRDSKKTDLKTTGAYAADTTIFKGISHVEPTHSNAYEISVNVGGYKDIFDYSSKYPNPIEIIGDFLATGKSSGYLFQLASFASKESAGGTPESASAVLVIDDNSVEKMAKKFDKSYENIKKRCDKLGIDFVYTFTETSMPKEVIDDTSAGRLISLLYTLDPGIYYQDEESGDIISAQEFSKIQTNERNFILKVKGRSLNEGSLADMQQALETTTGLSDVKFTVNREYTTWTSKEATSDYFIEAIKLSDDSSFSTLRTSDLNFLAEKRPSLSCVSYGFNQAEDKDAIKILTAYMAHVAGVDEDK